MGKWNIYGASDRPLDGPSVRQSVRKLFIQMLKGDNFLCENHQGGPNLTLLNVLNVLSLLNVLNMPKDASLASGPCFFYFYYFFSNFVILILI